MARLLSAPATRNDTQVLLDFKVEINAVDVKRDTPLSKAARSGKVDVVEVLLGAGAEIEVRDADNNIAGDSFNSKVSFRQSRAEISKLCQLFCFLTVRQN